jgi:hypothetical protein
MDEPKFSDEDRQRLILAYLEGAGAKGATRAEVSEFVRWCEMAAVLFTIQASAVLAGRLNVDGASQATFRMIELVMLGEVLPFKDGEGYRFTVKGMVS